MEGGASGKDTWQPQEAGDSRRKLSQTVRDLARDLRDCSFLICAFLEDRDCSTWKAFSFLLAAVAEAEAEADADGFLRRRGSVDCLEAVKNWVEGDCCWGLRESGGRLGVLKLDMSLRSVEEDDR